MKKLKQLLVGFLTLSAFAVQAQSFAPGQVLTAAQLNSAFANVLPIAGGTLTGPLTVPTLTVTTTLNTAHANITGGTIAGLSSPLPQASGGTGTTASSGTGAVVYAGAPSIANPTFTGSFTAPGLVGLPALAAQSANTLVANATGSSASPTAIAVPSCSTTSSALNWTNGAGVGCNTAINAATLGGATFAAPGPIGSTTASTGAFTTLSSSTANPSFSYNQGSAGAVNLTYQAKFQQTLNVNDFGADPTGTLDSTTALTNALAACPANGCRIQFGAGTYLVAGPVTINKQSTWAGANAGGTQITTNSASNNIFDVTTSSVYIRDLQFTASVTRTGGAYILLDTTSSIVSIENVYMLNWYYGIRLTAPGGPFYIRNVLLKNGVVTNGQAVRIENGTDVALDYVVVDNAAGSKPYGCVVITASADVSLINSQLQHCNYGLSVEPGAGQVAASIYAVNTFFDNAGAVGAQLVPKSSTGIIAKVRFNGCWFSSASVNGLLIDNSATGGGISAVEIIGAEVFSNSSHGIAINVTGAGNGYIGIVGGKIAGNTGVGVLITNGNNISITGSHIGSVGNVAGNTSYGVQVLSGTTNNLLISGNDLTGNTTAAYTNANASTSKIVANNLGYNPIANTGISVGASPFTYTNNTGAPINVFVEGGTVSLITNQGNGVASSTNFMTTLPQGASMQVTYSAAPGMSYSGQ